MGAQVDGPLQQRAGLGQRLDAQRGLGARGVGVHPAVQRGGGGGHGQQHREHARGGDRGEQRQHAAADQHGRRGHGGRGEHADRQVLQQPDVADHPAQGGPRGALGGHALAGQCPPDLHPGVGGQPQRGVVRGEPLGPPGQRPQQAEPADPDDRHQQGQHRWHLGGPHHEPARQPGERHPGQRGQRAGADRSGHRPSRPGDPGGVGKGSDAPRRGRLRGCNGSLAAAGGDGGRGGHGGQHQLAVGQRGQRRVVGHQQHGHRAAQVSEHSGHPGGGRVVQVCGGLVEQQQLRTPADPHQRPGQRDPLQLAGGQRAAAPSGQVARADPGERVDNQALGDDGVQRVRRVDAGVQPELVGHRVAQRARVLRHDGDPAGHPGDGAGHHGRGGQGAGQRRQQGGLARARGAGQRDQLAGLQGRRGGRERGRRPAGVGDRQAVEHHAGAPRVVGRGAGRGGEVRGGEHGAGLGRGLPGVGVGVVGRAQRPQRGEGLRGEQQRGQPDGQPEVTIDQPQAHGHRDQGDRQGGDQLEHQGGQEGQPQRGRRRPTVVLPQAGQRGGLLGRPAQAGEHGQSADQLGHVPGDPVQRPGGRRGLVGGVPADQHHEHRHQRQGQRDQHGRQPVGAQQDQQQDRRDDDGLRERRQVGGQRRGQVVQPGGGQHRGGAGAAGGLDRGGGAGQPVQQGVPQLVLAAAGVAGGQDGAHRSGAGPQQRAGRGQREGRQRGRAVHHGGDAVRQTGGQPDQADRLHQGDDRGPDDGAGDAGDAVQRCERAPARAAAHAAASACSGSAVRRLRKTQ
ncbi:unannotated protein [freshwater metagenome]|uniref:Unannotated protein n=1 Tax=freshwater metagenome TaxID=449393 RepID=A0A6J7GS36_9ZZZZ